MHMLTRNQVPTTESGLGADFYSYSKSHGKSLNGLIGEGALEADLLCDVVVMWCVSERMRVGETECKEVKVT